MKANGKNKVLFGTNYPMITPRKCLADLESLDLKMRRGICFYTGTPVVFSDCNLKMRSLKKRLI